MMPLRAISQDVRVQPHCSNNLFKYEKTQKVKTHAKARLSI